MSLSIDRTLCRLIANNQTIFQILNLKHFHMCPYAHGKSGDSLLI